MRIPPGSRVYIDTMVWIYHLFEQNHVMATCCERFLQEIEDGHLTGVSSSFTVQEALEVAKRSFSRKRNRPPGQAELAQIEGIIDGALRDLGIELHDSDRLTGLGGAPPDLFARTGEIIKQSRPYLCPDGAWRAVGGADAIHLAFSERSNADYYATCDQGFKGQVSRNKVSIVWEDY